MTITLNLSEELQRKLEKLAQAGGFANLAAFVQRLVEEKAQDAPAMANLEAEFRQLADQWRQETKYLSVAARMAEHPAYGRIVAMGHQAVPLILAEMERAPDHWFVALREITGANPVSAESRGKVKEMAEAWLNWGRAQGYRW